MLSSIAEIIANSGMSAEDFETCDKSCLTKEKVFNIVNPSGIDRQLNAVSLPND